MRRLLRSRASNVDAWNREPAQVRKAQEQAARLKPSSGETAIRLAKHLDPADELEDAIAGETHKAILERVPGFVTAKLRQAATNARQPSLKQTAQQALAEDSGSSRDPSTS